MTLPYLSAQGGVPKGPPVNAPNAALLIDFDNVTMGIRSDLQTELRRLLSSAIIKGKVAVQRAYADWRRYPQYIVPLSESSIDLIFAPAFGPNKKNATDIRLAIDALELVFTRPEIGTFILLSGDSDFSSLVLKLKEYGKYVIGVGIRDSSSDLLIQNCDEYYSYSELTGLTKTGEVELVRRDPWELVVQAIAQMARDSDVMRSDRLKQVMIELDPNFDEKDAGFSRFSKFVVEAGRRGLLAIQKRENGQYEVAPGPQANIEGFGGATPKAEARNGQATAERRRGRRSSAGTPREREAETTTGLALSDALDLLRASLGELAKVDGEAVPSEQVLERMLARHGADDPILAPPRFARLLRQAHDAAVVDLEKRPDGAYLVTLKSYEPEEKDDGEQAADKERPRPRRRSGRGRSRERGRSEPAAETASAEAAGGGGSEPRAEPERRPEARARSPRYRRGSRGRAKPAPPAGPTPGPADQGAEASASDEPDEAAPPTPRSWGRRPRRGHAPSPPAAGPEPPPSSESAPKSPPDEDRGVEPASEGGLWARLSRGFGARRSDQESS